MRASLFAGRHLYDRRHDESHDHRRHQLQRELLHHE
jgi:hypothetical protein